MKKLIRIKDSFYNIADIILAALSAFFFVADFFHKLPAKIIVPSLAALAIIGTIPVIYSTIKAFAKKQISVDLLASVALVATIIAREWHPAVFINLMLSGSRIFSRLTQAKSKKALKSLVKLRPVRATIKIDGTTHEISVHDIKIGDIVIIKPGEQIPVDGRVVEGDAVINQSALTGESIPVAKTIGDPVFCSTICDDGTILIVAEKIGRDTTFEKFVRLTQEAQKQKAQLETIGERFATWYIFAVLFGALIIFLVTKNTTMVLATLLVTCADDIAVAIPMAFTAAMAKSSRLGVIIKGGKYIEALSHLDTLLTDKTGTLTYGKPELENVFLFENIAEEKFLGYLAAAESQSTHPLARAILRFTDSEKIKLPESEKHQEITGRGVITQIDNDLVAAGRIDFLLDYKFDISSASLEKINEQKSSGHMIIALGINKKIVGFVTLQDKIREQAYSFFRELPSYGVKKTAMLTGDNEFVASHIAHELGIGQYFANLLPGQKLEHIKSFLGPKSRVAMIGDGVNDAAALSLADVGVAMGVIGTDAAIEAADVALMKDDLDKFLKILKLSKKTLSIIKQNFGIWMIVNIIGLALTFTGHLNPQNAALYHFITDIFPIANALRMFY